MLTYWYLRFRLRFLKKLRFRRWIELEDRRSDFIKATEKEADLPDKLFAYLSVAFDMPANRFYATYWLDIVNLFTQIININSVPDYLPILKSRPKKMNEIDWDYEGRNWYYYSHLIADAYGWDLEYIANLSIMDAIALIQEILTDEQLNKEFIWMTTEIAYPYDKTTKSGKFRPLDRPAWMLPKPREVIKIKIPVNLLPVGIIIKNEEDEAKETKSARNMEAIPDSKASNNK